MDAGRELDKLIAEKVMDEPEYWSVHFGGSHYGDFKTLAGAEKCAKKIQGDYKARVETYFDCPHYSTDIVAAWEVVEKLGNWHGFDFIISIPVQKLGDEKYEAGWYEQSHDGPESRAVGYADTAPLAICLAALKAVGYAECQREERS